MSNKIFDTKHPRTIQPSETKSLRMIYCWRCGRRSNIVAENDFYFIHSCKKCKKELFAYDLHDDVLVIIKNARRTLVQFQPFGRRPGSSSAVESRA